MERNVETKVESGEVLIRAFSVKVVHTAEYAHIPRPDMGSGVVPVIVNIDALDPDDPAIDWKADSWTDEYMATFHGGIDRFDSDYVRIGSHRSDNAINIYDEDDIDAYIQLLTDIKVSEVLKKKSH